MKRMKQGAMVLGMAVISAVMGSFAQAGQTQAEPGGKISISGGKGYLDNNQWGSSEVPSGWQKIYYSADNNYGWQWNWPSSTTSVKGYPSVVAGWHWTDGYTKGSGLPVQLAAHKNVNTSVKYAFAKANGTYNAAYDLWLHTTNKATWANAPTDEVMIWLNRNNGALPAGSYKETVTLAGTQWDLYVGKVSSWNVYSFVRKTPTTSASLNMTNFTDHLLKKNYLTKDKYLSSVEFGTEIYNGSGAFRLFNWDVTVK